MFIEQVHVIRKFGGGASLSLQFLMGIFFYSIIVVWIAFPHFFTQYSGYKRNVKYNFTVVKTTKLSEENMFQYYFISKTEFYLTIRTYYENNT